MTENLKNSEELKAELPKKVDLVFLNTNTMFVDSLAELMRKQRGKTIDVYYTAEQFLENFEKYPKDTKFCLNYNKGGKITGKDVAIKMHDAGYTRLYLYSTWTRSCIEEFDLPDYLRVILYEDLDDTTWDLVNILCI
jgi:hypothetical protein